jgi:hypothetical protein
VNAFSSSPAALSAARSSRCAPVRRSHRLGGRCRAHGENALQLVVVYAEAEDDNFDKAAVRWLGRLLLERPMTLAVVAHSVELVSQLRGPGGRIGLLGRLRRLHGPALHMTGERNNARGFGHVPPLYDFSGSQPGRYLTKVDLGRSARTLSYAWAGLVVSCSTLTPWWAAVSETG